MDDSILVRDARVAYFEANGFGVDGGYNDEWVKLKMGPIPFRIPNTAGRKVAVRYHDLHHIVTGYETDWVGEFEISAWEIGSGCRDKTFAWLINSQGMGGGLFLCPRRSLRAFVRGRNTRNLYDQDLDALLDETVQQLRQRMGTAAEVPNARPLDVLLWFAWSVAWLVPVVALVGGGLWWFFS
jgi:hypothetical protein